MCIWILIYDRLVSYHSRPTSTFHSNFETYSNVLSYHLFSSFTSLLSSPLLFVSLLFSSYFSSPLLFSSYLILSLLISPLLFSTHLSCYVIFSPVLSILLYYSLLSNSVALVSFSFMFCCFLLTLPLSSSLLISSHLSSFLVLSLVFSCLIFTPPPLQGNESFLYFYYLFCLVSS